MDAMDSDRRSILLEQRWVGTAFFVPEIGPAVLTADRQNQCPKNNALKHESALEPTNSSLASAARPSEFIPTLMLKAKSGVRYFPADAATPKSSEARLWPAGLSGSFVGRADSRFRPCVRAAYGPATTA
jgi:hypothetical protein